jgi:superfamily II DNA or RNA helicase
MGRKPMKAQLSLLQAPAIVAGEFTPRPYQSRANSAINREHEKVRSTLVVHPTGSGKTVVFCMQALKHGGALVIAHRDTLIRQAAEKLQAATGKEVAIEKGAERAWESPYVVSSVQSLHKSRLVDFKRRFPAFPLIIVDEAHRATSKTYRNVLDAYPDSKVLGVTATPDRSDGVGMRNVFESVADEYSIIDCTADGWLTPLRFQPVSANVDLSGVKVVGKGADRDFDQAELDNAIVKEAGRIAESVFKAVAASDNPDGRLIVFCPGVKTAHAGMAAMNAMKEGCAAVVDGTMEGAFQRAILKRHRAGEVQFVFNCGVLLEGYDDATLWGIFDAAPTKSRLRALQKWGRATRLWPTGIHTLETPEARRAAIAASPKPWAQVFDLAFNSAEHDVVSPLDNLLDGKDLPKDIMKRAREIMQREGGEVTEVVDRAKKEAEDKRRRALAAKRLAAATEVTLGTPRSVFDRAGLEFIKRKHTGGPKETITAAMWGLLKHRGIPIPPDCTVLMFRRLLTKDKQREAKGLCRLGGVDFLAKFGIDAWKMPRETAIRIRDKIKEVGNRKLSIDELTSVIEARQPGED